MRAVIWTAVSSQQQATDDKISPVDQERLCREWCERNGYAVLAVLSVLGHSRRDANVPRALDHFRREGVTAYDDLETLWENNAFDVLVAYTHSRFGRSNGLYTHVVENTILSGAKIYLIQGGWIDAHNFRMQVAIGGTTAVMEIDRMVQSVKAAARHNAAQGKPISKPLFSHQILRGENGKAEGIVLDESKQQIIQDAAALFIEGVGWASLELELGKRFGHYRPGTGKPYAPFTFHRTFYSPMFWGNSVLGYRRAKQPHRFGLWCFDPSVTLPENVEVFYGVLPPALTGDLAEQVKTEMRRRQMIIGSRRPHRSAPFSGLIICPDCQHTCVISMKRGAPMEKNYFGCRTHRTAYLKHVNCSNKRLCRIDRLQAQITVFLKLLCEGVAIGQLFTLPDHAATLNDELSRLERQISTQHKRLSTLIEQRIDSVSAVYQEKIEATGKTIKRLQEKSSELKRQLTQEAAQPDQQYTAEEIRHIGIEGFWEQPPTTINQSLHRLMGDWRFVMFDGEIQGLVRVTSLSGHSEGKRTRSTDMKIQTV